MKIELNDRAVKAARLKGNSPNQHPKQWDANGTAVGFRGPGSRGGTLPICTQVSNLVTVRSEKNASLFEEATGRYQGRF